MKPFIYLNVKHFLRMCLVGSIGFSVQMLSYNLLRLRLSPVWAVQISIVLAMLTNFYAHGHLTFEQGAILASRRGLAYLIYSLIMLVLQGQWLHWGVKLFGETPLIENSIMLLGIFWGTAVNFCFYRFYLWPKGL